MYEIDIPFKTGEYRVKIGTPLFHIWLAAGLVCTVAITAAAILAGHENWPPIDAPSQRIDSAGPDSPFKEKLEAAAKLAGINLKGLPERKSAPEKCELAAIMKKSTSVSNGWLAERLDMGKPASASQFARRWLLDEKRARRIQGLCKELEKS